jgi:hypothetical protein
MSESIGTPSVETVHEAYAFACMRCGHGWEQSYEIQHHTDQAGRTTVTYHAGGTRVPSPLTRPSCQNCGGHVVRIMRPGRVAGARWDQLGTSPSAVPRQDERRYDVKADATAGTVGGNGTPAAQADQAHDEPAATGPLPDRSQHHWRLADLLHLFHLPGKHQDHDGGGQHDRAA